MKRVQARPAAPMAQHIARRLARALLLSAAALGILALVLCALIVLQGRRDETQPAGAAVVLGAAQWNGTPSPVFRARLDHAQDLFKRGLVQRIILTGGVGAGDHTSEAGAGRAYLLEHGVTSNTLLLEEHGTTTWQSLQNAAQLARGNGITSLLLVSDSYHMLRSLKMAHDLNLNAYASPIRTSEPEGEIAEARHVLREAAAYVVYVFARQ